MLFLRLLGRLLIFAAFLALAYDGVRALATPGSGLLLTSLSTHLNTHFPQARESLERFFLDLGPSYLWTGVIEPLLVIPVSLLFGVFGVILYTAGYASPPPEITGD